MKIMVINGSPKKEKSDVMHLTRAFLKGMDQTENNEISLIHLRDKHIEFCSGCLSCMRNGGSCIHQDDMKALLDQILESDLLLFSFPLYGYGMPALMKNFIDRILPLSSIRMRKEGERTVHEDQASVHHLSYVVISGCGFPNSRQNFEPLERQLELLFRHNRTVITVAEAPMFNAPQADPVTKPFLSLMEEAGREYGKKKELSAETLGKLSVPMIPEDVYIQIVNSSSKA